MSKLASFLKSFSYNISENLSLSKGISIFKAYLIVETASRRLGLTISKNFTESMTLLRQLAISISKSFTISESLSFNRQVSVNKSHNYTTSQTYTTARICQRYRSFIFDNISSFSKDIDVISGGNSVSRTYTCTASPGFLS